MSEQMDRWRRDYEDEAPLLEEEMAAHPVDQFQQWFEAAAEADFIEPNAMTLATAAADGTPAARIVLLKEYDRRGFVFYTNYQSAKAGELKDNPRASLLFHWDKLGRTVRISGTATKVPREMSETYFQSRPRKSQIGAWASHQSQVVASRAALREQFETIADYYEGHDLPTPEHWGGYRLWPEQMEFWQGQRSRMHDRLLYSKQRDGTWVLQRLSP